MLCASQGGRAYLIEVRPAEEEEGFGEVGEAFRRALDSEDCGLRRHLGELCPPQGLNPADLVFLDIETTGLGSTPLFLIGTMEWGEGRFAVRQYLARDYSEEAAAISLVGEVLREKKVLVTFNGKSFDMPYIRTRAAANAVAFADEPPHFDLLHECRRIWRGVLPNCRLQTLESRICGRLRSGDIPGAEIPAAYHAYVRTGDAAQMIRILHHNALDLMTMADLMVRFPPAAREAARPSERGPAV